MATNANTEKRTLQEPEAHVTAKRLRVIVRSLLALASIAALLLFLFNRPATYLAAIPILVLILVLALINELERRSRTAMLRKEGQTHINKEELETDIVVAGFATALEVAGALALGTFIVAAALFDFPMLGIGATALLLLAVLIEIPYLGLFVTEAERDELEKERPKTHSVKS